MFGDWGGFILQFTVTTIIVVALVGAVYWLVRRYSAGGLGRIGRGRVPRLAVIDAMAVDGRRRLVLVRRDNIEHLLLIGGPSDIVVEQAIQRPRRPAVRPQPTPAPLPGAEVPQEPLAVPGDNPPIPFPQFRAAQPAQYRPEPAPQPAYQPAPAASYQPTPQPIERPFTPIRRSNAQPSSRPDPVAAPAATIVQFEPMADPAPLFPELQAEEAASQNDASQDFGRRAADLNGARPADPNDGQSGGPFALPAESAEDTATKVNDLEREMARLLGEITAKRPS